MILSYPMSAPVSRVKQRSGSGMPPESCHASEGPPLTEVDMGQIPIRGRPRTDANALTYSTATLRQRSTLRVQLRRILSQALLSRIIQASTHYPTARDLSRDLRCVHQITILRSTLPPHPPMNRQHSYRLIFPSHLPCHYLKQLLCMPVRATRA